MRAFVRVWRAARQAVANQEDRKHPRPGLADWEGALASVIARKFERREPDELEAELTRTVLTLKARAPPHVQDWEKYLAKALHNRAHNWIRKRRGQAKRETAPPGAFEEILPSFSASEADPESQVAFAELWRQLGPERTELWNLLGEARRNLSEVARRLGKHPNTLRLWIRKIQQIVITHGFPAGLPRRRGTVPKPRPAIAKFISIAAGFLQAMAHKRLSGTQWRMILWVLRETSRRKRRTTPFTWSRIAQDLRQDRGDTWRAGKCLLRTKILFIQDGRIGLQKHIRRSRPRKRRASADDSRR